MTWIKLDDGVYAEEPSIDHVKIIDIEALQKILSYKNNELLMLKTEQDLLADRISCLELDINEINSVLQ